jgi:excisionase family DNA binding protein
MKASDSHDEDFGVGTPQEGPSEMECTRSKPVSSNDTLTAAEVGEILRIHPVTVRLNAAAGQIPGRQIGNRWRFSRTRIHEWLKAA